MGWCAQPSIRTWALRQAARFVDPRLNGYTHPTRVRIADYRDPTNTNLIGASKVLGQEGWSNATAIIISHNNPSGDPTPSPEDIALTKAMVKAGQMLDMEVLDHVVVGRGRFVSLKARGLGFDEK